MKAIAYTEPGGPDVLEVMELPDPVPGPGEVVIRVRAAAVSPTDTMRRVGMRDVAGAEPPYVVGMDAAGMIESIGSDTDTDLEIGDAVMAIVVPNGSHGAYSEKIAVPVESVARIPDGASLIEASTLPMNGLTARLALDKLNLPAGSTIAVTGAAGAFGGYSVQLAKADGHTVVADASEADEELVASLGADVVLRRGEGFAAAVREKFPEGVDGMIDGSVQLDEIVPAAKDGATIVTIRGDKGERERGVKFWSIVVSKYAKNPEELDTLRQQAEDGVVTLRVAEALPMDQAPEAHRRLEAGGVRGRIVLEF
ncbi:MAG: NADP-dependent oxidoreductase [Brevibacterium yomogidense]|uniref:Lead, cadmium, zinc and mercury transporting ATPase Copper-translocating P-type ATPase n=1 Tax=Brevibacterium yomogidense TaxID=946573 RepID=A0A1X6X373_9MICO|nr:NADP-dependent oxidoreductase [Brevibacterium yomogidense]SLM92309.1 Lead, cadmium, zinc and mercury transporting ATPase; Copper-translocating P-type ATPase [Brevibacterium yomogidense]